MISRIGVDGGSAAPAGPGGEAGPVPEMKRKELPLRHIPAPFWCEIGDPGRNGSILSIDTEPGHNFGRSAVPHMERALTENGHAVGGRPCGEVRS
jgi:hypothetical protein